MAPTPEKTRIDPGNNNFAQKISRLVVMCGSRSLPIYPGTRDAILFIFYLETLHLWASSWVAFLMATILPDFLQIENRQRNREKSGELCYLHTSLDLTEHCSWFTSSMSLNFFSQKFRPIILQKNVVIMKMNHTYELLLTR